MADVFISNMLTNRFRRRSLPLYLGNDIPMSTNADEDEMKFQFTNLPSRIIFHAIFNMYSKTLQ